jgi:cation diffusion facilitator family transporter
VATGGSKKAIVAAMIANAGIAIAKFVAFLVTGAASMLAESIHSVADTSNQGLLLLGSKRAQRAATPTHPFGYGRERYFWSFVVALVLFSLGGLFALFEGIEKIRHPHEVESLGWAVGVLLLGIVLEGYSFRTAVVESLPLKGDRSWSEFIRRARTPELPVVLLEDAGALTGLVVALIAVLLASLTGNAMWDGVGTVTIGVLLVVIAIVLAIEMKSLLIGESATDKDTARIRQVLESVPSLRQVIHMRTQHIGPDELLVAAKVEFSAGMSMTEVTDAIDRAETAVRDELPMARMIYLEPDTYEDDYRDAVPADDAAGGDAPH